MSLGSMFITLWFTTRPFPMQPTAACSHSVQVGEVVIEMQTLASVSSASQLSHCAKRRNVSITSTLANLQAVGGDHRGNGFPTPTVSRSLGAARRQPEESSLYTVGTRTQWLVCVCCCWFSLRIRFVCPRRVRTTLSLANLPLCKNIVKQNSIVNSQ